MRGEAIKRIIVTIVALLMICIFIPRSLSEDATWEGISWLHKQYGFITNQEFIDEMNESFQEKTFKCGSVQVTLKEVLYDGVWMYTTAVVSPIIPNDLLIMPSSAGASDFVAGGYKEGLRDDHRSFIEAATEDHKNLLWVQAFPDEFGDADFYFIDHRQDAGEQSTLFSGAPIILDSGVNTIHFTVETNLISSSTGEVLSSEKFTVPVVFHTSSSQQREYFSTTNGMPFDKITLIKMPLATHVFPNAYAGTDYVLLDKDGNEYRSAIPEHTTSLIIDEVPDTLVVQFHSDDIEPQNKLRPGKWTHEVLRVGTHPLICGRSKNCNVPKSWTPLLSKT